MARKTVHLCARGGGRQTYQSVTNLAAVDSLFMGEEKGTRGKTQEQIEEGATKKRAAGGAACKTQGWHSLPISHQTFIGYMTHTEKSFLEDKIYTSIMYIHMYICIYAYCLCTYIIYLYVYIIHMYVYIYTHACKCCAFV